MEKTYHLIGIGGIGMAALAKLLLERNFKVTGTDVKDSALIQTLIAKGATIHIGHDERHLGTPDYVVYSSAINAENPEMARARDRQIPVMKRAELLSWLMQGHTAVTVAGAHGKTSTSSMAAWMLLKAGFNPTVAVGGIICGLDQNSFLGNGRYFVAELDESDGSFLFFRPQYSIVTNIDFEHVDYYQTWERILAAYEQFVRQTPDDGLVIACGDDERLRSIVTKSQRPHIFYGFSKNNEVRALNITEIRHDDRLYMQFDCDFSKDDLGTFQLPLVGRHYVSNALSCITVGFRMGLAPELIKETLKQFPGVKRRMEKKGFSQGIAIYDDYGHHPTEIRETLTAVQSLKDQRLITVFQPHRYSRTKYLLNEFVESLQLTDELIITDIYAASEAKEEAVSGLRLCELIKAAGKTSAVYLPREEILDYLQKISRPGDLVLTLGAGDIYRVGEELARTLESYSGRRKCLNKSQRLWDISAF